MPVVAGRASGPAGKPPGYDAASAAAARVTVTSGLQIRMSTMRSLGASQTSSRRTASAMELRAASWSDSSRRYGELTITPLMGRTLLWRVRRLRS